jgi:hypothetical protein
MVLSALPRGMVHSWRVGNLRREGSLGAVSALEWRSELSDRLLRGRGLGAEPASKLPSEAVFVPRPVRRLVREHGVTGAGIVKRRNRRHANVVGPGRGICLGPAVPDDGVEVHEELVNPATAAERNGNSNSCLTIVLFASRV